MAYFDSDTNEWIITSNDMTAMVVNLLGDFMRRAELEGNYKAALRFCGASWGSYVNLREAMRQ